MARWTAHDDDLLRKVYTTTSLDELQRLFGRSENAIRLHALAIGLTRTPIPSPHGNLKRLLEDTPTAAYWNGFIAADGAFSDVRLKVFIAEHDRGHLEKLTTWLGITSSIHSPSNNVAGFAIADTASIRALRERFDIRPRKTYNPPQHLPYDDDNLLRAWFIGYVDGDGHIKRQTGRQTAILDTVAHLSWKPFLEELVARLGFGYVNERTGHARYPDRRYVAIRCARHNQIAGLKRFATEHQLPILTRKWDRVDTSIVLDRHEKAARMKEMILAGHRATHIARELGCTTSAVSNARKRMGA